jgi:hypothetical protein
MCEQSNRIILCSCLNNTALPEIGIDHQNEEFLRTSVPTSGKVFTWTLYQYKGERYVSMLGSALLPSDSIGDTLHSECVAEELNEGNCFDFAYEPCEKDKIYIDFVNKDGKVDYSDRNSAPLRGYMAFEFRQGKWLANPPLSLDAILEMKNFGNVSIPENYRKTLSFIRLY